MARFSFPTLRKPSLWRGRAPVSSGEIRRIERWLASARVALALASLVAIAIDPGSSKYSLWAYALLCFYIIHGLVIMLLLRIRQQSTLPFRLLVHGADLLLAALISMFATSPANPFFLFFVFVLAAAAYRWGLWETVGTAAAGLILLWAESLAYDLHVIDWADRLLHRYRLPGLMVHVTDFEPSSLIMRSIYLLVLGLLLGYLAEQQKQLRAEKAVIARILARVRVDTGLSSTLQEIVGDLLLMYRAQRAIVASQEIKSQHVFIGEVSLLNAAPTVLHWLEPDFADRATFLFESDADTVYLKRNRTSTCYALDKEGDTIREPDASTLEGLANKYSFKYMTAVTFQLGSEWWGRMFLLDPDLTGDIEDELHFLQELVRQVSPAIYNVYLIRRLRQRAGAMERARFARELHDGAVQSLIAVEMQLDVLRRQAENRPDVVTPELGRIQGLLREEVLKLRELMQQMKSLDVDSRKLLPFLTDTVERFQRETGISARFVTELDEVDMPQHMCRELARIVQEGLVNVRKHSRAHHVLVRLGANNGNWQVVIEDDGTGFPFSGRLSHSDLEVERKGPVVIKERLRLIAGELTIESNPGRGSRLEINVPRTREVAYG